MRTLHAGFNLARRNALRMVKRELRAKLPKGWQVSLMVGWGFCVHDADGNAVVGNEGTDKKRLTKQQAKVLELAAEFCDLFGYDNERIKI